jgi:hypothetical protein
MFHTNSHSLPSAHSFTRMREQRTTTLQGRLTDSYGVILTTDILASQGFSVCIAPHLSGEMHDVDRKPLASEDEYTLGYAPVTLCRFGSPTRHDLKIGVDRGSVWVSRSKI